VFKDILNTIAARYLVAFLNLLLIFINSKALGREGIGIVGLIYTSANIILIFNSLLCGNTIVYFINKYNLRYVFLPAYIWAFAGSAIACCIMYFIGILPVGYEITILSLAILITLFNVNTRILLGKDNIKWFNVTFIIQGVVMFSALIVFYYIADYKDINAYLVGLFLAYTVGFCCGFILIIKHLSIKNNKPVNVPYFVFLKEMTVYGIWSCIDGITEILTTRLNYFMVLKTGGYGNVGMLDVGTKISESVWHISNSISFIEYNNVSKTTDNERQKQITLRLFKLTFCALIIAMLIIVCIPEWIYTELLLTEEFAGIRHIIIGLSAGVVALGSNRILIHHFIGSGNIRYSAFCSISGLVAMLIAGTVLTPLYGVFGAVVAASIAYTEMLIFSTVVFIKLTGAHLRDFIPVKEDFTFILSRLRGSA